MATDQPTAHAWNFKDLTGLTFGKWTVLSDVGFNYLRHATEWLCRCACGAEAVVNGPSLTSEKSVGCRSCGHTRHGQSTRARRTPEHNVWVAIKSRCYGNHPTLRKNYQDRGIRVCTRWRESFEAFLADMGSRPSETHSIDREDNDGNYSCGACDECHQNGWPANCRWATLEEQASNRRTSRLLTFRGETLCLNQWGRRFGINAHTILYRLATGLSIEAALTTPRRGGRRPL